jgi:ABC-type phosphate/phosphonate transport system ATPase subunit
MAELANSSFNEIYLDDVASGLYDLRAIGSSISGTSPLTYMVNGTVKSIEGYTKHLIDETRMMLKKRDLKASRTKVTIAWTVDQNEMRGDKLELLSSLENRLKDYIGEVETQQGSFDFYPTEKTMIVIACSKIDLNNIISKNVNSDLIVIKAIPILQTID